MPARPIDDLLTRRGGSRRSGAALPLWFGIGFVGLVVTARVATQWHLPYPECWLRKLTGLPCPSCGCTRGLLAWSQLDLAQAFFFNPLFFLLCVGVLAWCVVAAAEKLAGRAWLSHWRSRFGRWSVWRIALVLIALNWLYLCLTLPK